MKKLAIHLFVLAVTFFIGTVFYSYSPTGISEAGVLERANQFHQALKNRDREQLNDILADNISFSRYTDQSSSKEALIEYNLNGECKVMWTEMTSISTEVKLNKVNIFSFIRHRAFCTGESMLEHSDDYIYSFER